MLRVGDTIRCLDLDDMLQHMAELAREGIETDWNTEEIKAGEYILHITEVEDAE